MKSIQILIWTMLVLFVMFFILLPSTSFGNEFISAITNKDITNLLYFISIWITVTEATLGFVLVKLDDLMEDKKEANE